MRSVRNGINTCDTSEDLANLLGAFVEEVEAKNKQFMLVNKGHRRLTFFYTLTYNY